MLHLRLVSVAVLLLLLLHEFASAAEKISFWNEPRRGANVFNEKIPMSTLRAAKEYSIDFLRVAPDKFTSNERDFLLGNADRYDGLVEADLAVLKALLDTCKSVDMPVVLVMLSLPGSRWKQNNGDVDDLRLWHNEDYFEQCANFWKDLATALRDHPAIVGYNILNEPHMERLHDSQTHGDIQERLGQFYETIIAAIRTVDRTTPIVVEPSSYSDPGALGKMPPLADSLIIYSVHMYEPYNYTNLKINSGTYEYPGLVWDDFADTTVAWDRRRLEEYFSTARLFQESNGIPSNRILVGEFGGNRQSKGIETYLSDLISIFESNQWHWAVYSFREDTWDGMDYELGGAKLPWKYWQALEKGIEPVKTYLPDNPIFKVLLHGWNLSK